jgi:hypothetical protein
LDRLAGARVPQPHSLTSQCDTTHGNLWALARATTRQNEVAIRAALGAARLRILSQFLAESAWIALPAGAIGVGLAYGSLVLLRPLIPAGVPLAQVLATCDTPDSMPMPETSSTCLKACIHNPRSRWSAFGFEFDRLDHRVPPRLGQA